MYKIFRMGNHSKTTTSMLVKSFTGYKLRRNGFGDQKYYTDDDSEIVRILKIMGDQFEESYFNSFEDMTNSINVYADDLQDIFKQVLDSTFEHGRGISWGRIVGAFVFAARLAVKARTSDRPDVVDKLIGWTTSYLEQPTFANWIKKHGDWDGFVRFYQNERTVHDTNGLFTWNTCSRGVGTFIESAVTLYNTICKS